MTMNRKEQALRFAAMHERGRPPLLLTNVWDAGSARAVCDAGAEAVATSSWAIAAAHGHDDGERLSFALLAAVVERIIGAVTVPVTIDFERGYAEEPSKAADNLDRLLDAGVIGINLEDGLPDGVECRDAHEQARRIEALRERADRSGIPLFLNARTDLFLNHGANDHAGLARQAKERAGMYAAAGASGLFVPGLLDLHLIADICAASGLPVNVMVTDLNVPLAPFVEAGVRRVSRGLSPYLSAMKHLGSIV